MRSKKTSKQIQTGRSLPNKYSSYNPAAPEGQSPKPAAAEPLPKSQLWLKVLGRLAIFLLILIITLGLVIGIWDARNISAATKKMFGSGNLLSLINTESLRTDSNGRVNVLVAGYSADDPGHAGASLTDSIMLLSMNPAKGTGYTLSIPRDLYVNLGPQYCKSGGGHCKINEAYEDGGMDLLVKTVQNIFNTQIGYYTLVNYSAVRSVVNAVGGIDVTINSPDGRLYDPNIDYTTGGPMVDLSNGPHHLNGQQALNLTRARGDTDELSYGSPSPVGFGLSDFQRTIDQRLVFNAIKQKLNWKLILNPSKNSKILNAAADNIKTNVTIDEARPLFSLFNRIPASKLQPVSLNSLSGKNYLDNPSYYGQSVLIPAAGLDDYSQIQAALSQINQQ